MRGGPLQKAKLGATCLRRLHSVLSARYVSGKGHYSLDEWVSRLGKSESLADTKPFAGALFPYIYYTRLVWQVLYLAAREGIFGSFLKGCGIAGKTRGALRTLILCEAEELPSCARSLAWPFGI